MPKCNAVPWMASGDRKRTLGKNQGNLNILRSLVRRKCPCDKCTIVVLTIGKLGIGTLSNILAPFWEIWNLSKIRSWLKIRRENHRDQMGLELSILAPPFCCRGPWSSPNSCLALWCFSDYTNSLNVLPIVFICWSYQGMNSVATKGFYHQVLFWVLRKEVVAAHNFQGNVWAITQCSIIFMHFLTKLFSRLAWSSTYFSPSSSHSMWSLHTSLQRWPHAHGRHC